MHEVLAIKLEEHEEEKKKMRCNGVFTHLFLRKGLSHLPNGLYGLFLIS